MALEAERGGHDTIASLIGSGQVAVLGFDPKDADALAEGVTAALLSGVVPRAS